MAKQSRTTRTGRKTGGKRAGAAGAGGASRRLRPGTPSAGAYTPESMLAVRDLFWDNVVRDMLNALSVLSQQQPEQFDGRFAVLTRAGGRVPIAQVFPIFACSIPGSQEERDASAAVQCTVFRIVTPSGEVFTMPVHEIRSLHTLSGELVERLQKAAEEADREPSREARRRAGDRGEDEADDQRPFGFAAYTSLPKLPPVPAPDTPLE
jgi:hypothetical protein